MSDLTRRLQLDLATLLAAIVGPLAAALDAVPRGKSGGSQMEVTGLDLVIPVRFELAGGTGFRVRLPSRFAPQLGHPGSLALHVAPAETVARG